ncbi:MAG: hypothetical protein ACYC27_13965 [Armatimonadota bacterium]
MDKSMNLNVPVRVILESVPRVNFYDGKRCPEDVPFPSCMRAFLEYKGESHGCENAHEYNLNSALCCTYAYFMSTSGAAFRLLWKPDSWSPCGSDIIYMSSDPYEPFRRAFESAGYSNDIFLKREYAQRLHIEQADDYDESSFRSMVIESIYEKGSPVIALGVVGPPECCIITGYDESGDVLIGWSFFQNFPDFNAGVEFELNGQFRKRDWFKDTQGLIIIGEKTRIPSPVEVLRSTLQWAIDIAHTPEVHDFCSGLLAYDAWADTLLRDIDFPSDDNNILSERYMAHYDTVGTVAEGRHYANVYLRHMAKSLPDIASELLAAADCYVAEHDLMWAIWEFAGGNGFTDEHVKKFADPVVRRRIVPLIKLAREKDEQAAEHLERALAKLS